ncbi:MAG: F0F1 ATP synthase subunit epsilon [bacterium]
MASKKIQLKIISPERVVFDETVDHVVLPSLAGEIDILPGHTQLMSALGIGPVVVFNEGVESHLAIGSGYGEVKDDVVTVLAETAERADEIDEERAQAARNRAVAIMESKDKASEHDQALVSAALQRSMARLKVLERFKKHRSHR